MEMKTKRLLASVAAGGVVIGLAACGSSSSSSSSSSASPSSSGGSSASATSTSGATAGSKIPAKTIGILESTDSGEGEHESRVAIETAAKAVGWKTINIDGNDVPSTMSSGMQTLISDKVDAIIAIYMNSGAVAPQLVAAKQAGIPVLSIGFTSTPNPNVTAVYAPDENVEAKMLIARMHKDLPKGGLVAPIAVAGYTGVDQEVETLQAVGPANGFKLLNRIDVGITNLFGDAPKAATAVINGNPNLAAIYMGIDIYAQLFKPAETQLGKNVPLYGFGAISSALPYIRKGGVTVVTSDNAKSGYIAINSLLDYFVNHTPIPATTPASEAFDYQIVDQSNVPNREFVYPQSSFAPAFLAKWKSEYGIAG